MVGSVTGLVNCAGWLAGRFVSLFGLPGWLLLIRGVIVWLLILQNILRDCTDNPAFTLHDKDQFNFTELRKADCTDKTMSIQFFSTS
jgi:hypothetical protein